MKQFLQWIGLTVILSGLLQPSVSKVVAQAGPEINIDAPAEVPPNGDFIATVTTTEVSNFDACQFDVTYDPGVFNVTQVTAGMIEGTSIPIDMWGFVPAEEEGGIRVIGNVPGVPGIDGAGYLAKIHFHTVGSVGTTSDISVSNGLLGNKDANPIQAVSWKGTAVEVVATASSTPSAATPIGSTSTQAPATNTPSTDATASRASETLSSTESAPDNAPESTAAIAESNLPRDNGPAGNSWPVPVYVAVVLAVALVGTLAWLWLYKRAQ
jgi:hypothetical protein